MKVYNIWQKEIMEGPFVCEHIVDFVKHSDHLAAVKELEGEIERLKAEVELQNQKVEVHSQTDFREDTVCFIFESLESLRNGCFYDCQMWLEKVVKEYNGIEKLYLERKAARQSLTSKLEIALGALRFYGDKENWTGAQGGIDNDIICSSDMENKIDNKTEIYAGHHAREAIQKIEAL